MWQSKLHYCITTERKRQQNALYWSTQLLKMLMFGAEQARVKNKEEIEKIIYVSE